MTDFPAELVSATTGSLLTQRTGTASGDTVPAGAVVLWRNTGAGSHTITLTNNATQDGLAVAARTIVMAAGEVRAGRINPAWGDANGRVAVAISAANPNEVLYYVQGGV